METLSLRPYQEEDANFLATFPTAGCFNEQRTGKTPTALAVIKKKHLEDCKILIISTKSSLYQWQYEYERWLNKPCVIVKGTPKQREVLIKERWTHGLVISLDTLKKTKSKTGCETFLLAQKPSMLILDEAHAISNPKTCSAQAIEKLLKIPNRLALTGTPVISKPEGFYNILHFLYPELFNNIWKFRNQYLEPEIVHFWNRDGLQTKRDYTHATFSEVGTVRLQTFLTQHCTQRKRKDVMTWLPDKDYQNIYIPLTPEQSKYLQELSNTFETDTLVTKGILDRFVRYRQICVDPELINLKGKSTKTQWILDFIEDNPDTPVIIFSNFSEYLKKLFIILKEHGVKEAMLLGDVPPQTRDKFRIDFQNGKFNVFLINIRAGKEALTLDRAEAIIFTDVYPPHGYIAQAEDRFVATTPERANKAHTIFNLITKDSYEENLIQAIKSQKTVAEVVNDFAQLIYKRR